MSKLRYWLLKTFGKLDNPEEFDYVIIMIMVILVMFFAVTYYIFVIL